MGFFLVHGSRVVTTFEKRRKARCGRCLAQTTQEVSSLERRKHLYFVEYGRDDLGRVAECEACRTVFPVKRAEGEDRKERWADSFLDAHVIELERADKSNWVVAATIALGLAFVVVTGSWFWIVSLLPLTREASFFAGMGGLLAALLLAGVVYRGLQERIGSRVFARAIRARLGHLDARWEIKPADLAKRASLRGYPRLAQHFSTSRYAARTAPDIGPYRS